MLFLTNTQLRQLPPEIGQLQRLGILDLRNNQLDVVSPELALLTELRVLDLRDNSCPLPEKIGELTNRGRGVYTPNNCFLPEEMLEESSGMIDRYLTGW